MGYLANENVPRASVIALRQAGHDVSAISEDAPGSSDEEVLARASREARVILTFDRDYGELIFHRMLPAPLGVVYFRFAPVTPLEPAERLLKVLTQPHVTLEGMFTTIERAHLRQRRLP